jgi:hypothetical protein
MYLVLHTADLQYTSVRVSACGSTAAAALCRSEQGFLSVAGGASARHVAADSGAAAAQLSLAAFAVDQQHRGFAQQVRTVFCGSCMG